MSETKKATVKEMRALLAAENNAAKAVASAKLLHEAAVEARRNANCPHPKKYRHGGMFYTTCDLCFATLD